MIPTPLELMQGPNIPTRLVWNSPVPPLIGELFTRKQPFRGITLIRVPVRSLLIPLPLKETQKLTLVLPTTWLQVNIPTFLRPVLPIMPSNIRLPHGTTIRILIFWPTTPLTRDTRALLPLPVDRINIPVLRDLVPPIKTL